MAPSISVPSRLTVFSIPMAEQKSQRSQVRRAAVNQSSLDLPR
jgi:hypothetical protein